MSHLFAIADVLSVAWTSQMAFANEHPQRHQRYFTSEQFRRASAAVVASLEVPSTMYTCGWSVPAGR